MTTAEREQNERRDAIIEKLFDAKTRAHFTDGEQKLVVSLMQCAFNDGVIDALKQQIATLRTI